MRAEHRPPLAVAALLAFLGDRAVPGIEAVEDVEAVEAGVYRRTLTLAHGGGVLELAPHPFEGLQLDVALDDERDRDEALARARHLADLDADAPAIDDALARDPLLAPSVRATPGLRVPHTVDGFELAVRAVLGQQVSVRGARTLAGRLVARLGAPLAIPLGALAHRFPSAATIAEGDLDGLGLTGGRVACLRALAQAVGDGAVRLDAAADPEATEATLLDLPGIGPWTASYVAMRALGDPDAFLPSDLGVRRALERAGLPADPKAATAYAERWRPWRAYAVMHLWVGAQAPR